MSEKKQHWETVYKTKDDNEVSWYQESPVTSLNAILDLNLTVDAQIIDVGGGNSNLSRDLLKNNFENLSVLDISGEALERTKVKLGEKGNNIKWYVSDVLEFNSENKFDIWHDRATFHFLTTSSDVKSYIEKVETLITNGGYLVLATFSKTGPEKCSGLAIQQYNEEILADLFKEQFKLVNSFEEVHQTPFNTEQNFIYTIFQKR